MMSSISKTSTMAGLLAFSITSMCFGQEQVNPQPKPEDESSVEQALDQLQQQATETQNQIAKTIRKMREVGARVKKTQVGSETQVMQKEIISNLDLLIRAAKQQQQQKQEQQQQQSPNDQQPSQQDTSPAEQQQTGNQPKPDGKRQDGEDASPTTNQGSAAASELAQKKIVLQQVWGHLPDRLRERVLNMSADKYLPKYEGLIRQYFESLAEKRISRLKR